MNAHKLKVFITAVEAGSFLRAADILGYTPSGVTHMMDSLEKSIGLKLMTRGRGGVQLTKEGERLLPLFKKYVALNRRLEQEIETVRANVSDRIHLCVYASIARNWIPVFMQEFRSMEPNITLDVKVGDIDEIYQWVYDGTIDIGFASKNEKYRCDFIPLHEDEHYAVFPPNVKLKSTKSFPTKELENYLFLMPSFGMDRDVQEALDNANASPKIIDVKADDSAILSMVVKGLGVSIFSELILEGLGENVQAVPLSPPSHRLLGMAVASHKNITPAQARFIAYVKNKHL